MPNDFTGVPTQPGGLTLADGKTIVVGSTTGSKIGTASTQKIAFYGATPIVQPSRAGQLTDSSGGTAGSTVTAEEASYTQSGEAMFRASVAARINALETLIDNSGLSVWESRWCSNP